MSIALAGELDLFCAEEIRMLLLEQLESGSVSIVTVDLAQVTFLDSTILTALVNGHQRASSSGRRFTVVNPSPFAQRLLSVTGLLEVFTAA